ncbi:serine/threonine protein kinase [Asanoa ishikariensis]|uniref:non-specific serine/threonine protein kinase n=2 Tax=Asanoa ishikariensis TaxID=137265 RepID=A0A1H3TVL9_9ACTN|nr:serine/threonine-protein kinase [Asanoa ishikariensis]GIF67572.1 serine/threonine protein kinase [Asanoa ishikariensis]SDZ54260.1 serine/threonine protein kinase [Asanoa ishikariensis]
MLNPGDALGGRYRLDEPIASGGMGEVWRARDEVLGRTVAVKVLHPRAVGDPGFSARFRGEARTMATLRHPGVVDVYDFGEDTDPDGKTVVYLVMGFVDGESLAQRIKTAERLSPAETMAIVAQTAHALQAAHDAGVVHRDVKPGNLIVRPDGQVVLVDFGVARSAEAAELTGVNELVGTALYMAPEQVAKRAITPATDIYALGAVAYHCLSGHPPFMGDNALTIALSHLDEEPPPLPEEVPQAVRTVIATAMAKDPEDRFKNAAAMAQIAEAAMGTRASDTATALTRAGATALLAGGPATTRPRPGYAPGAAAVGRGPGDTFAGSDPRTTGSRTGTAPGGFAGAPGPGGPPRKRLSATQRASIITTALIGVAAVVMAVALANLGDNKKDGGTAPTQPAEVSVEPSIVDPTVTSKPTGVSPTKPRNTNSPRNNNPPATTKPPATATAPPDDEPTEDPPTSQPPVDPPDPTVDPTGPVGGGA